MISRIFWRFRNLEKQFLSSNMPGRGLLSALLCSATADFFFRTMHFLYSKFLWNATRTSARRKSRGSRKKWASWLLEHVKGGKFSVETTAKIGTNTSPLKLDCCLFSAWGVIHMIGTKFEGNFLRSWLCGCFLVDPQKHQSYAFGPSICYSLARQLFNTWVCPNG